MIRSLPSVHAYTHAVVPLMLAAFLVMAAVALLDERPGLMHNSTAGRAGPAPCATVPIDERTGSPSSPPLEVPDAGSSQVDNGGNLISGCATPGVPDDHSPAP